MFDSVPLFPAVDSSTFSSSSLVYYLRPVVVLSGWSWIERRRRRFH